MAQSNKFVISAMDRSLELLRQEWGDSPKLEHVCMIISEVVDLSQASDELIEATARNAKSPLYVHSAPRAFAPFLGGILPSGGTTFADLACGSGQTLLAAAETRPEIGLARNDVNHSALEVAACRLFLRDRSADLDVAGLLQSAPRSAYDRVVLHPPFGLRISETQMARLWPFGAPPKGQSDLLWPQAAYQELADNRYPAVVLPTAALSVAVKPATCGRA